MTRSLTVAETATRTMLRISNVRVTFERGGNPLNVLSGIDLEIFEGEFVCVLGPSGCGKSSLLSVVGGFLQPTEGVVTIDDEPVKGPDRNGASNTTCVWSA